MKREGREVWEQRVRRLRESGLLAGYKGYLVVDAHVVYDHLFKSGELIEAGCNSHSRRYFFKALETDPERARHALTLLGGLFRIERALASASPEHRLKVRRERSKPIVDAFFTWCEAQAPFVLDETPIAKAVRYALNHRAALSRFLDDGRLPIHNNFPNASSAGRRWAGRRGSSSATTKPAR